MYRVGIGYDLHRLGKGRKLVLGGVNVPFNKGLIGHSDADVLTHAICDALLGACARKDIGVHFPDSQPKYKNISSIKLLQEVRAILSRAKYSVCNIDAIIVAEKPKLAARTGKMCLNIARAVKSSRRKINVKSTTTEGTGSIGRSQAIAAYAIALIKKK